MIVEFLQIQIPNDRTSGIRTFATPMLTNKFVEICSTPLTTAPRQFIPLAYQQTSNGEWFLLFDSGFGDNNRMLIFVTDQALQLLANSEDWFCAGTFSVCQEILFQLYTVHARLGQSLRIFALLPNKTRETYNRFFRELSHLPPETTYQRSYLISSLPQLMQRRRPFQMPISLDVFFIWHQMFGKDSSSWLRRPLQQWWSVRSPSMYDNGYCICAPPPDDVIDVFERLSDLIRLQYGEEADELLDYFESTYIGRYRRNAPRAVPMFQIGMWNMFHRTHQEMPRTNNHIEGGIEGSKGYAHVTIVLK